MPAVSVVPAITWKPSIRKKPGVNVRNDRETVVPLAPSALNTLEFRTIWLEVRKFVITAQSGAGVVSLPATALAQTRTRSELAAFATVYRATVAVPSAPAPLGTL